MGSMGGGGNKALTGIAVGVVVGAMTGGIGYGLGFSSASGWGAAIASGAVMGGIGGALSAAAGALMGSGVPEEPSLSYEARDRSLTISEAIAHHRVIYGRVRAGGARTFMHATDGNQKLHMVVTVAGHEVAGFDEFWLNDELVPVNADGTVSGKWAGYVRVWFGLGTEAGDSEMLAKLRAACPDKWTADHKQTGCAKVYIEFTFNADKFASGIPAPSFVVRGKPVKDIRTGLVAWNHNAALCQRDYLVNFWGWDEAELDSASFTDAADACDEYVPVTLQLEAALDPAEDLVTLTGSTGLKTGDPVNLTTDGSLPAPLLVGETYHWIKMTDATGQLAASATDAAAGTAIAFATPGLGTHTLTRAGGGSFTVDGSVVSLVSSVPGLGMGDGVRLATDGALPTGLAIDTTYYWCQLTQTTGKLCTTAANALARVGVTITGAGTGTHTMTRVSEPRYACNGTLSLDQSHGGNLTRLLSASRGEAIYSGGKWVLLPAVWRAPTITLDEDDLAGPVSVSVRQPWRDVFNGVKGVFVNPDAYWQADDFPAIRSSTALAEDNGEEKWKDVDLPFTTSAATAQRIAKIDLLACRQQITVKVTCKLTAMRVRAGSVIKISLARYGWVEKPFKVEEWGFVVRGTTLLIEMALRETDESVFDWASSEEQTTDPAPNTDLPDLRDVDPPASIDVVDLPFGDSGAVAVTLGESAGPYLRAYQVEYLAPGAATYTVVPAAETREFVIRNLAPGAYIFRGKALSTMNVSSAVVAVSHTVAVPSLMPRVSGLELVVDGAAAAGGGTVFTGPDAHFVWRDSSVTRPGSLGDDGSRDLYFQDYEVRVRDLTGTTLRVVHTLDPMWAYTHDMNALDAGGPRRAFAVEVYQRGTVAGQISPVAARLEVSNPAPALPTAVSITAGLRQFFLRYTAPTDLDWEGILVWVSTVSGFTPTGTHAGTGNCVYRGSQTTIVLDGEPAATYYLRFACFDRFGTDDITLSPEFTATIRKVENYDIQTGAVRAEQIDVETLSAITADIGVISAGVLASPDGRMVFDLDNQSLIGTGPAGQAADDYWKLDASGLSYFKWDGNTHTLHKTLTRRESGVAAHGATVQIPGYFDSEPTIGLSPYSLDCYDPTYSAQKQRIKLDYQNLTEFAAGRWSFDVVSKLELASASGANVVNDLKTGSSNTASSTATTTPANCTAITVHVALKSVRGTGTAPNYYKRKVDWRIGYRIHGSGSSYTYTTYQTKAMSTAGLTEVSDQRAITLPSANTWDVIVEYSAADLDGTTFTYGSGGYDYTTASTTGTSVSWSFNTDNHSASGTSVFSYSPPAGWEVYNVDYSMTYTHDLGTGAYSGSGTKPYIKVTGTGLMEYLGTYASYDYATGVNYDNNTSLVSHTYAFTSGSVGNVVVTTAEAVATTAGYITAAFTLQGSATVYLRKPITNSSTPDNSFKFESYDYTLSAAAVVATGSVLWDAVGE